MKQLGQKQQGFTLIEIAIVLVIIGLLLGGVLKGQELIENGRVKNAANDMNGISVAVNAYRDRYRALPGDDNNGAATMASRGNNWTGIPDAGDSDGVLDITLAQTFTGGGESDDFFQHLRAAGLITGNPADVGGAAIPTNAFGGPLGVTNNPHGMSGPAVCLGGVPGKAAVALDNQLDDGRPGRGSLRANGAAGQAANTAPAAVAGAVAAAYNENNTYTICRTI
ncbi:prepilin-type N-terminal cleavage/methylation domain-containing protein [Chitinimonas sp. BJYL2]|uniref:prepilin-type N-terminal cleavage/methylation domain-containing protein n=1 Tax=Chitinimonas sp. BJYL2 TaxID=2976696 RepID=UPI0022B59719|nr:prepilin-type N-terminal cleavage/methylation domain-containing protein [Chitinimonas sp. BJYL2]